MKYLQMPYKWSFPVYKANMQSQNDLYGIRALDGDTMPIPGALAGI